MKSFFGLLMVLNLISLSVQSQTYNIPKGSKITVDGIHSANEWTDAASTQIRVNSYSTINVKYKHDGENLFFTFYDNLLTTDLRCPEILFDMNNDKSSTWSSDDWWFHVSATDCYKQGVYGDYTTCKAVQPDWTANNMMDEGFMNIVEICIPLTTLGIENGLVKTFGICIEATDTQTAWSYAVSGTNKDNPATWQTAEIDLSTSGIKDFDATEEIIFDNDKILIQGDELTSQIQIFDISGEMINSYINLKYIDISNYRSGVYIIKYFVKNQYFYKKFIKL